MKFLGQKMGIFHDRPLQYKIFSNGFECPCDGIDIRLIDDLTGAGVSSQLAFLPNTDYLAGSGLDAVGASASHEFLTQPMTVGTHTIQFKIGAVHPQRMAGFPRRCSAASGGGAAAPFCAGRSTP